MNNSKWRTLNQTECDTYGGSRIRYQLTKEDIGDEFQNPSEGKRSWSAEEKNATLWQNLRAWNRAGRKFLPALDNTEESEYDEEDGEHSPPKGVCVSDLHMTFPSSMLAADCSLMGIWELCDAEKQLREGQAMDALEDLRHSLQIRFIMQNKKHQHVSGPGQRINTQSNRWIHEAERKVDIAAKRYRSAWGALEQLDPGGIWQKEYQLLKTEDIRSALQPETATGKGYVLVQQSWIWGRQDAPRDGKQVNTAISNDVQEGGTMVVNDDESEFNLVTFFFV